MPPALLIPGTYRLAHYAVSVRGVDLQAHLGTSGAQSIHQVGDVSIICCRRVHELLMLLCIHILTRSDRSIDSKITSFGHQEHRSHISALVASNTLGPPACQVKVIRVHYSIIVRHSQPAPSCIIASDPFGHEEPSRRAHSLLSYAGHLVCWHDLQRLSRTKVTS